MAQQQDLKVVARLFGSSGDAIQRRFDRMEELLNEQKAQILALQRQLQTSNLARDANEDARSRNQGATRPDSPLIPLRDVRTNQEIANFPKTVADVYSLSLPETVPILEALALPLDGDLAERHKRIRVRAGSIYNFLVEDFGQEDEETEEIELSFE